MCPGRIDEQRPDTRESLDLEWIIVQFKKSIGFFCGKNVLLVAGHFLFSVNNPIGWQLCPVLSMLR